MSDIESQASAATSHTSVQQPSATDRLTAEGNVQSNATGEARVDSKTKISSLENLKETSPKIYNFMMLSIAQNICIQANRSNDRLIAELKKLRRE